MNPYLINLRKQYDGLRTSIEGLQTRAAEGNRDLTEDELRSVTEQAEQARKLAEQIESLSEIETRNRKVAELAASVAEQPAELATAVRGTNESVRVGTTETKDRDPGHYVRSGQHSFFGDIYRAKDGDEDAARRLAEHNRALTTGTAGAGIVPPHWLTEEYDALARQGRSLANAVRNVGLGTDPRPITLPKQSTGTDDVVTEQAAENGATLATDEWASTVETVIPKPTSGIQIVSRQMLDMANPAIDALIYGDMLSAYNLKIEKKVGAALVAAAGTAVVTYADDVDFGLGVPMTPGDAVIDTAVAVRNGRKLPADIVAMTVNRYGEYLKLKDDTGRPLMPLDSAGPMNVIGSGSVAVDGRMHGLGIVATDGVGEGGVYPESIVVLRAADTVLFESDVQRFRYEEPLGPESVKLGIWAYSAVIVRQSGKSAKRIVVTVENDGL